MYSTFILVGICAVAFLIQIMSPAFTDAFALISAEVLYRPWTLITTIFLHADVSHLLYNMFALVLFGMILENIIGQKRFLAIYFVSGFLASVGSLFLYNGAVGASGAIFGVLGTLALLRPRLQVWVYFIPMPMIVAAIVWATGDIIGLFVPGRTANLAHLIGLGLGLGNGWYLKKQFGVQKRDVMHIDEKEFDDWERKWMRK
jgi:membrane associated rhomboid family serine protease